MLSLKTILTLIAVAGFGLRGVAQQWLAPGACWVTYSGDLCSYMEHHEYVSDSTENGMDIQIVEWTRTPYFPGVGFLTTSSIQRRFYSRQGNVVLDRNLFPVPGGNWDTLYVLGVAGDRWWPRYADQTCPPLGMIEIQDTGHVVIDGISLRTWDLAYLDEFGEPIPEWGFGDTLGIIEHIGSMVGVPPLPCNNPNGESCAVYRLHYSDDQLSFPDGTTCEITTNVAIAHPTSATLVLQPNPGTDQLAITGIASSSRIEVRDALGRLVHSQNGPGGTASLSTNSWPSGAYFINVIASDGQQFRKWIKQ